MVSFMLWPKLKTFLLAKVPVPVWLFVALGSVGLLILAILLWPASAKSREWLHILVDDQGRIDGLIVHADKIPREVLEELPSPYDRKIMTDRKLIQQMAQAKGLYEDRRVNPHLIFDDGVIDWWSKNKKIAWELELEFLSRRLVLEAADRKGVYIPAAGDLSRWAERLHPFLKKRTLEKRE